MKTLLTALSLFILIPSFGQGVLNKWNSVEKFGWNDSISKSYWMQYYSSDTLNMVSIEYDSASLKSISSSISTGKFIPQYDSTLVLENYVSNGANVTFYSDKKVKSVGTYYLGNPIGEWIYYYPSGKLKRIENYPNDSLIYEMCEQYSVKITFGNLDNEDSPTSGFSQSFKSIPHGDWIEYYENGNQKYVKTFDMGLAIGIWTSFYENGLKVAEGSYLPNIKKYPCNSRLKLDIDNLGKEEDYMATDNIIQLSVKHGMWKFWDSKGVLIERLNYNMGTIVE